MRLLVRVNRGLIYRVFLTSWNRAHVTIGHQAYNSLNLWAEQMLMLQDFR